MTESSSSPDRERVVAGLRELASYLWLEGDSFRARAYQRAAEVIENVADFERLHREGKLTKLPRIGAGISAAIAQLIETGTTPALDKLRVAWPEAKRKTASGRRKPAKAKDAAAAGPTGLLLPEARELAETLALYLARHASERRAQVAGETRRAQEVTQTISVAAATDDTDALREQLRQMPMVLDVDASDTGATVRLATGMAVEVHAAPTSRWGVTLVRATGSAAHWQKLRARAGERGIDLDRFEAADEPAVYEALGLPFLPPEVREGGDEIESAELGAFDERLVELADVRGAVHCHTTYSDGKNSILEMAEAAVKLGLDYLTITDHSSSAHYAGGLKVDDLRRQWDEIDEVQEKVGIRLLKGTEADILADGALDWPDSVLESFDVVIASVHQRHKLDEDQATQRLVRAMRLPVFKIWGHALGRLVQRREPIACRMEEVLDAIASAPAAIEINGDPHRLDLEPRWARRASERGIRFVLSSDAHSVNGLRAYEYAVSMARRARLRPGEVLNTLPVDSFMRAVKPKRGGRATTPPPV
jgi:DNA polymerase (family 10)